MQIKVLETESKLFGRNIISVYEFASADEIISGHEKLIRKYKPWLIYCKVNACDIKTIQRLEKAGYGFCEFRIHSCLQISQTPSTEIIFPYELKLLGDESHLEMVKEILRKGLPDDRFYNDPLIENEIAHQREILNIGKSFHSWPGEFVLGLFNMQTSKLIGFRSGAFSNDHEAYFYLYGILPKLDKDHYSRILDHLVIDFLYQRGVRIIHSVSTGFNTDELNRLVRHHGFRIESTQVLMRKVCDEES